GFSIEMKVASLEQYAFRSQGVTEPARFGSAELVTELQS
ncbi:hypothetical protein PMI01_04972, partial [Caulobacter sp. AP07]